MACKNKIILFLLAIALCACQQKGNYVEKLYYDSGELEFLCERVNDSTLYVIEYYKNGNKKSETTYVDSMAKGKASEYYSDGTLKWEGEYYDGKMIAWEGDSIDVPNLKMYLDIRGDVDTLIAGQSYEIRTYVKGIHPKLYMVGVGAENCSCHENIENKDMYPDFIIPKNEGTVYVCLNFPDKNGTVIVGKYQRCFVVPVKER